MQFRRRDDDRARELLWGDAGAGPSAAQPSREFEVAAFGTALLRRAGGGRARTKRIVIRGAVLGGLVLLLTAATVSPMWLMLAPAWMLLEYLALTRAAARRAEAFEKDYVPLLLSMASAVRTGLDPLVALDGCAKLFSSASEMRRHVEAFQERMEHGAQEDEAIRSFARDIAHPDVQLFRSTLVLARRQGSSLSQGLQRLARVTRQRQSFRRKMRASLALQRLSAIGIAGCAVVIGVIQAASNPQALSDALAHPIGRRALTLGVSLIVIGLCWMLFLSRRRV